MSKTNWLAGAALANSLLVAGCFHEPAEEHDHDGHDHGTPVTLSGVLSAPGGSLAFRESGILEKAVAAIFGKAAVADLTGVQAVPSATVDLVKVDATGAKVGDTIATATTDATGAFTITLPDGVAIDSVQYVVMAEGTTETLSARVTGTDVDVDPVSHHANNLITEITAAHNDLSAISLSEAQIVLSEINEVVNSIDDADLTGLTSVADFTTVVDTAIDANEETSNIVSSMQSDDAICGTVKDANNTGLANIKVVARDFGKWVTRSVAKTDSTGAYCMKLPAGDYIIGAINNTTTSTAASEWWSTDGTAYAQIDAEKVTVPASLTAALTRDFTLEPGARLRGSITATGGALDTQGIQGVAVVARNFNTYFPYATDKTDSTGSYVINVIPGDYILLATNRTKHAYGGGSFDGVNANGAKIREEGKRITLTAGQIYDADFTLASGYKIAGQILRNGDSTKPVTGQRVRINLASGGSVDRIRTNLLGKYRIWLQPDNYSVDAYGQENPTVDLTASNKNVSFVADVGTRPIKVVDHLGDPVSQAKVILAGETGANSYSFIFNEVTSSDGTGVLVSNMSGNHKIRVLIDDARSYGSTVHSGQLQMSATTDLVTLTVGTDDTNVVTVQLPEGNVLSGTITDAQSNTVANASVSVKQTSFGVRTRGDGTYTISLPGGSYNGLNVTPSGSASATPHDETISITANQGATVDVQLQ